MKVPWGLTLVPLLVGLGCASPKPTPPRGEPPATSSAFTGQHADETLGVEIRRRLTMAGSELVGVVVSVSDGVVTMRGSVANAAAALRAEAAVRGVSGVKSVRNDLLVRGAAGY